MKLWSRASVVVVAILVSLAVSQPAQAGVVTTQDGTITRSHFGDIDIASVTHVDRVGDDTRVTVAYTCPRMGPGALGDDWMELYIEVAQWRKGQPLAEYPDSEYFLDLMDRGESDELTCDGTPQVDTYTLEPNLTYSVPDRHPLRAGTARVTVRISSPPHAWYSYVDTAQRVSVTAPHLPEVAWVHDVRQASSDGSHGQHSGPGSAATMRILYRCWDNPYGVDPTMIVDVVQDPLGGPGQGYHRGYGAWFGESGLPQPQLACTGRWRFSEFTIYQGTDAPLRRGAGRVEISLFGASGNVNYAQRISVRPAR